jgi:uncharacterized DUF497 family protein
VGKNPLVDCIGFEWDEWNSGKIGSVIESRRKNQKRFFPTILSCSRDETGQSSREKRYGVPGQTAKGRRLFVVFTVRGNLIRVISARDLNQKEAREYRRYEKSDS